VVQLAVYAGWPVGVNSAKAGLDIFKAHPPAEGD